MIKEIKCQLWLNTYKVCFACKALFLPDFMCYYILKTLTPGAVKGYLRGVGELGSLLRFCLYHWAGTALPRPARPSLCPPVFSNQIVKDMGRNTHKSSFSVTSGGILQKWLPGILAAPPSRFSAPISRCILSSFWKPHAAIPVAPTRVFKVNNRKIQLAINFTKVTIFYLLWFYFSE